MKTTTYKYRKNYGYLIRVIKSRFQLVVLRRQPSGRYTRIKAYKIGIGRARDTQTKLREGDCRTPIGTFYICQKQVLPSEQPLGPRWMRLTWPNPADIRRGLNMGVINEKQGARLRKGYTNTLFQRIETPLGFGIGIHGTDEPGSIGKKCSDGCIRMHNRDVVELYDLIPMGTKVQILK